MNRRNDLNNVKIRKETSSAMRKQKTLNVVLSVAVKTVAHLFTLCERCLNIRQKEK